MLTTNKCYLLTVASLDCCATVQIAAALTPFIIAK